MFDIKTVTQPNDFITSTFRKHKDHKGKMNSIFIN